MGDIIVLLVIVTSIWVLFDAKSIGIQKGQI
jgi:heme/copper-type cytochrome/quinol oxidase subunit 4